MFGCLHVDGRARLLSFLAFMVSSAASLAAPSELLFSADAHQALTTPVASGSLRAFIERPSIERAWRLRLDPRHLHAAQSEVVLEVENRRLRFARVAGRVLPGGDTLWQGQVSAGSAGPALLAVRSRRGLTATLTLDDVLYRLVPLGAGEHLLLRIDAQRLPPAHPPGHAHSTVAHDVRRMPGHAAGDAAGATPSVIRLLFTASANAAASYPGDLRALAELAIAESNRTYAQSQLPMRLQLAGFRAADYEESRNMQLDLRRYVSPDDGFMDDIHGERDRVHADVAILLLQRAFSCGEAFEIGATAATAFAAVLVECAAGQFTLAHEVGHLAGARHDLRRDPATTPFAYGHGHWYQPPRASGWRTVMSYDCPTGCPRVPYWSSPDLRHEGVPTGDAVEANNRRVLDETRAVMAASR